MDRIKVTLRMGPNDEDLILLTSYYQLKQALIFAVRKYLNRSTGTLSLPPPTNVPTNTWHQATIYKQANPDVYQFLKGIPERKRTTVIKRLLRHATEECDLRSLLEPQQRRTQAKSMVKDMPQEAAERPQKPIKDKDGPGDVRPAPMAQRPQEPPKRTVQKVTVNLDIPQQDEPGGLKRTPPHNEYRGEARDGRSIKKPSEETAASPKQQPKDSSREQQRPEEKPAQPIQSKKVPPAGDDIWSQL